MTKNEFYHAAALNLVATHPTLSMDDIAERARELTDIVFSEEQEEEKKSCNSDSIDTVVQEIDKMEYDILEERRMKWPNFKFNKMGYAKRFRGVCDRNDIHTVEQLIKYGKQNFRRAHNIGEKCMDLVCKALDNLYDIKAW